MKVGIVGYGLVGSAMHSVARAYHKVYPHDKYKDAGFGLGSLAKHCDLIFICVPTPCKTNGEIDLTELDSALLNISKMNLEKEKIIAIKSTIVPGTTRKYMKEYSKHNLKFAHVPEFLSRRTAIDDMSSPNLVAIGTEEETVFKTIGNFFREMRLTCPVFHMKPEEAEILKYMSNMFSAMKITMANEFYQICQLYNASYSKIKSAIELDKDVNRPLLEVPGPDGKFGFGGPCLRKDLEAFIHELQKQKYNPILFSAIWARNQHFR